MGVSGCPIIVGGFGTVDEVCEATAEVGLGTSVGELVGTALDAAACSTEATGATQKKSVKESPSTMSVDQRVSLVNARFGKDLWVPFANVRLVNGPG